MQNAPKNKGWVYCRSSHQRYFFEKGVLKNFANSQKRPQARNFI